MKELLKNKRGVFGLTAVQAFFSIILGIALLAYVIVVVMGTLGEANILDPTTGTITNESIDPTDTGTTLSRNVFETCSAAVTVAYNLSNTTDPIHSGNWTMDGCTITNTTSEYSGDTWNITYPFSHDSSAQVNTRNIVSNTSTGVSGFFSSINPVYAILAILVIILILVVLVRVVQSPGGVQTQKL